MDGWTDIILDIFHCYNLCNNHQKRSFAKRGELTALPHKASHPCQDPCSIGSEDRFACLLREAAFDLFPVCFIALTKAGTAEKETDMGNRLGSISASQPIVAKVKQGDYEYIKDQISQLEEQCDHDSSMMTEYLNWRHQVDPHPPVLPDAIGVTQ